MTYADTSVLSSLVLRDAKSFQAVELVSRAGRALAFTPLHRLEVENSIRLCLAGGRMNEQEVNRSHRKVEELLADGRWAVLKPDWKQVYARASGLSRAHTSRLRSRSLDILHVASAMDLALKQFWSFDTRQRALAEAVGLKLNPMG